MGRRPVSTRPTLATAPHRPGRERMHDHIGSPAHTRQLSAKSVPHWHDRAVVMLVRTSALSLARLLWWYGEDELWPRALQLPPSVVADLASEFGRFASDRAAVERVWPTAPRDAPLLIPVIQYLEGRPRPALRTRRRPRKAMPAILDVDEAVRLADPGLAEVSRILDDRQFGDRH